MVFMRCQVALLGCQCGGVRCTKDKREVDEMERDGVYGAGPY